MVIVMAQSQTTITKMDNDTLYESDLSYTNNNSNLDNEALNMSNLQQDHFIFPSQKAFFSQGINATKQGNIAILQGEWSINQSRSIADAYKSLAPEENKPIMKSISDYIKKIPGTGGNNITLRVYDPGAEKPSPVLIFVHGGGWTTGNIDIYDDSIRRLAKSSELIVVTMNYRLAPENPFPAGLEDVISIVKWIYENGTRVADMDADRIALGGDSAGATLALSTALYLRNSSNLDDKNIIDVLYLLYGPYSPQLLERESMKRFGQGQYGLTYAQMNWAMNQTFTNSSDYQNPLAFPLLADSFKELPPIYIAAMGLDPLKDESIHLAEQLEKEDHEYYLSIWPGVAHGALSLIPLTPEIEKYLDAMTIYLRGVLER